MKIIHGFLGILIILAALALMAILFLKISNELRAGLGVAMFSLAGVLYTQIMIKKRESESRLFEQRSKSCEEIIKFLFSTMDNVDKPERQREAAAKKAQPKLNEAIRNLLIWGTANIIEEWNIYTKGINVKKEPIEMFVDVEKLLRAIRKELGHDDKNLANGNLVAFLIKGNEKDAVQSAIEKRMSSES